MANTTRRNSSDRERRDSGVRSSYAARTATDGGKKTQNKTTNNHAGQKRSGLNRDQYDSAVRSSYSARASANSAKDQVSEQEFNRSASMQRSYGNYQNYQQGRKVTAGGFYSKPTPSQETTAAMQLTKTMSEAIGENRKKNYLVELAKKIGYKPEWTADAAQRNQTEYEDLYARYQEARAKSEPLYEAFLKDEEQWRKTIRGKDEVAADVERLNQMKSALEDRQKQLEGMAGQMLVASRQTAGSFAQAKQMQAEAEAIGKQIDEVKEQLALVGEEQGWEFYYRYEKYKADPDFALKSQYTSEPTGERIPTTEEQMMAGNPKTPKLWKSISYEMINGNQDAIGIIRTVLDYDYTGDELGEHLRGYEDGRQVALGMTDEERATFNYLYHARGAQAAAEYFYELEAIALNTRFREKKEGEARGFAQEYPVAANVYSVVVSNLTKPVTFLNQVLDYADDGKMVKDAPYNKHSYIQSAIRDETSKNWHPVGQFAYQTGMSLADFAYTTMITGGLSKSGTAASKEFAKNMSLAIMGTGAAADTTLAAKDRGLSDGKALTLGTVAGMAEILTEKFSIDTLLESLGSNKGIAYLAKNMAAEGSEEVASDLINLVADVVVARDQSEWRMAIEAGMAQGLTEQEAFSRAFAAETINIGLSGLGGVVSGGVMGGGYMAYSKGVENKYYNEGMKMIGQGLVTEEGRAELMEAVQAGLQLEKDNPAYKQAKAINDKIEKGKKISALEAGRMYTAVSAAEEAQFREQAEKGTQNARPSDPGMENGTENARPAETVTAGTPTKVSGDYVAVKYTPREVTQGMTEQEATGARWGVQEETVKRVGDVSRLLGVNVVWYREGPENGQIKDGYYNRETGKIYLNAETPNPVMQVISHELTHALEGTRSYGDFYRLVLGEMTDLDAQVQDKIAAYAGAGITLNSDGAKKEIVAHYVQTTLLTDEQAIRRIVRKNTGFGRWMMNSIDKLLAKLGNKHAKERLKLHRASDLYAKALREFQKEAKYLEATDGRLVLQKAEYTAEDAERARRDLDEAFERGEITEEELTKALDEIDSALEESEGRAAALAERTQHSVSEDGRLKLPKVEADTASYSISEIVGEKGSYGLGVVLDTDIFDGVRTRYWGTVLKDYVYNNLAGAELTMYDAAGNSETVYLARENDRVKKDGAKNSHKVIDKLARYNGDNIKALATVHLSEALTTSRNETSTNEHSHQWMDEKGWIYRTTYLQDRNGSIYEAMLNIADGRDRRILYDINNIRKIDIKKDAGGVVPSTENGRGSHTNGVFGSSITADGQNVKKQFSVGDAEDGKLHLPMVEPVEETAQDTASGETDGRIRLPRVQQEEKQDNGVDFGEGVRYNEIKNEGGGSNGREMDHSGVRGRFEMANSGERTAEGAGGGGVFETSGKQAGIRVHSGRSGRAIYTEDSEGRRINNEQAEQIEGTAIVDEAGRPIAVYHFTPEMNFEIFNEGDIGFHFGTQKQAQKRGKDLKVKEGRMFRAYLNIKNPLRARLDIGAWKPNGAGLYLWSEGYLTNVEWDAIRNLPGSQGYRSEASVRLREILRSKGYDGIVYPNGIEGVGDSYIALSDEQIIRSEITTIETRQFSVSDKVETEQETTRKPFDREDIPWKWRPDVSRAERHFASYMGNVLGVPNVSGRDFLTKIGEKLTEELLTTDKVSVPQMFKTTLEQAMEHNAAFCEKYNGVGEWLKTTALTPSEQEREEIEDFDVWAEKTGKTLKIADEDGVSIEDGYDRLHEIAPDLFPEDEAEAEEKVDRILKAARGIETAERSLDKFRGSRRSEHKRAAKVKFDDAIRKYKDDMKYARRHDAGKIQILPVLQTPTTVDEAVELQRQIKQFRAECDRVLAKHPLNASDRDAVDKLLQGKIKPKDIKRRSNFEGILAVYEARKELEDRMKPWKKWQEEQRGKKNRIAEEAITEEDIQFMKDKGAGILYARETMQRNNEDVMPPEVARKVNALFFDTIRKSEKKANEFKTAAREWVKKMKLSRDVAKGNLVSESHAVQLYGEAITNIEIISNSKGRIKMRDGRTLEEWQDIVKRLWIENPKLDKAKIQNAVQEFRVIYDKLLELMNRVRVENGYETVSYREGYFPHFQGGGDGIMAKFAAALGITMDVTALPTTINGLTYTFNPGITWFGNTMERIGFATTYDAVEGFDKYIEGVSNVIFFTENIQMLRALERRIRYLASPEGIRKQIKAIQKSEMTEAEQQTEIEKIMKKGKFGLSNYVNNLHEYTNILAGKKSGLDRGIEDLIGRRWYNLAKAWEKRIGANMVGANFGSALTNFIPLQQAGAQLPVGTIMKAMLETLQHTKQSDGIAERSAFISNRKGSDPIVKTWVEKASGKMSLPMEYIDSFVAETIVRAKYGQNIKAGLSEEAAMDDADAWAARIMAERSKGGMPTLFASTNPIVKMFTQFQLEVNNEFSLIFKDIPRANREKGLKALAAVLLRYIFGAYVFNEFYEFFVGRRPALDPLNIINETVGDFSGYEIPNLVRTGVDLLQGEKPDFTTKKETGWDAAMNLAGNLAGGLPFSSGLALLGLDVDGGRIPAASGVPSIPAIAEALGSDADPKKKWDTAKKELNKLAYVLPPFGGGQLSKMIKGIKALAQGGSYSVNREGEDILQYPVYRDSVGETILSAGQMALFGKSATREAQEWVDSGFQSLSAKETAVYQDLAESGMKERDAFAFVKSLQGEEEKRQAIIDSNVSDEAKVIAFYGLLATKEEKALLDSLDRQGFDGVACAGAMLKASVAETKEDKLEAMAGRDLEPEAYIAVADKVGLLTSDKQIETMKALAESGQDMQQSAELLVKIVGAEKRADELALIRDADLDREAFEEYAAFIIGSKERETETGNRTQFAKLMDAVDGGLDRSTAVQMQIDGHDLEKVISLMEEGMKPATAANVIRDVGELEPEEGYDDVQAAQKWRACVDAASNPKDQLEALRVIMNESQFEKVESAYNDYGIAPEAFVRLKERLPEFDEDGNGSFKQAEVTAAMAAIFPINVLPGGGSLSNEQKAALWQLWTGSKSAKNNPYSRAVGQQVIDARNAAKEAEEAEEVAEKDYRLRLPR